MKKIEYWEWLNVGFNCIRLVSLCLLIFTSQLLQIL